MLCVRKSGLRGRLFAFPPDEDAEEHLGSKIMSAKESMSQMIPYFEAKGQQYSAVVAKLLV